MAKKGFYELQIAGLTRQLPICKISDELSIAGFVIFRRCRADARMCGGDDQDYAGARYHDHSRVQGHTAYL